MKTYNKHPFKEFVPPDATKLIIGTIPPSRFCYDRNDPLGKRYNEDVDFYYGSRDNKFWKLISDITGFKFAYNEEGVAQRQEFLSLNKIGITDIVEECEREGQSAEDSALAVKVFRDIKTTLSKYPKIDTLIYTSDKVKSFMYQHTGSCHSNVPNNSKLKKITINGFRYNVIILYSPSPSGLRRLKGGESTRVNQYKEVFSTR